MDFNYALCLMSYRVSDEYQRYNYGVCHKVFWIVLYFVCYVKCLINYVLSDCIWYIFLICMVCVCFVMHCCC